MGWLRRSCQSQCLAKHALPSLSSFTRKHIRSDAMVRFKGIGFDFAVPSGPQLIRKVLVSSNHLDWNTFSARMFGQLFGAPNQICHANSVDDSGIAAKPHPGSKVHTGRRLIRNQIIFFNNAFSKKNMDEIVPRFLRNLYLRCSGFAIDIEWVEMDDLFAFVHDLASCCAVESFFG
ncbi:hypothetical protein BS50DRAFT_573308 [Corynespora cassiicola Philippines]|uniref:Uncharacterized protein n=1 Tax=Corynespora cassiicola Philippines TaxID=1448308 RepID=A0A2T2NSJ1_CORCC|nr:hypothetical protein BS50DRAFT_573308 [Corynespora cassiicola Philippines]